MDKIGENILPGNVSSTDKASAKGLRAYVGIFLALTASALFALALLVVKLLKHYHPFAISFWRIQGMTPIIPIVIYYSCCKNQQIFSTVWPMDKPGNGKNILLLLLRCISSSCSIMLQVYSVQYISVADSSTISYSTPVFVTLASHVFFGEKSGIVPVLCGIVTLFGVVIITRPPMLTGEEEFNTDTLIGSAMALGCMIGAVATFLALRGLRKMHFSVIMLFVGLWGSAQTFSLATAISRFDIPEGFDDWFLIGALVFVSFLAQICITLAFKFEQAGTIALCRTFDIVFAFIWQYIFIGVVPDNVSLLGGGIVIIGVLVATYRKYLTSLPVESELRKTFWFMLK